MLLSDQLTALTHLELVYHHLSEDDDEDSCPALMPAPAADPQYSCILQEVQECWAELPALRSLQLGPHKVPYYGAFEFIHEDYYEPLKRNRLVLDNALLSSVAALNLTNLCLGPSACLGLPGNLSMVDQLQMLVAPLQALTNLCRLNLIMQTYDDEEEADWIIDPVR